MFLGSNWHCFKTWMVEPDSFCRSDGSEVKSQEFYQQLVGEIKVLFRSYVRVFLLPSYVGIITSHYKDSCELTSRMEWDKLFFPFLAQWNEWSAVRNSSLLVGMVWPCLAKLHASNVGDSFSSNNSNNFNCKMLMIYNHHISGIVQ